MQETPLDRVDARAPVFVTDSTIGAPAGGADESLSAAEWVSAPATPALWLIADRSGAALSAAPASPAAAPGIEPVTGGNQGCVRRALNVESDRPSVAFHWANAHDYD